MVLGAALATMVLTGSLLTGDAVKATLRRQALARVGNFDSAFWGGDRFLNAGPLRKHPNKFEPHAICHITVT